MQTLQPIGPTEVDSSRLIPENTDRIYFGAMMDGYLEQYKTTRTSPWHTKVVMGTGLGPCRLVGFYQQ
jgi:hypothetical protein